jgi:predicted glycoside hydrolase/deacetylase ChbG (UPF0249 family)
MLIINADDYGKDEFCTDRILSCFVEGRVTSASAMVFMADSERAADLALGKGLDAGLHLNLSLTCSGEVRSQKLKDSHACLARFFSKGRYIALLYNPLLRQHFEYVFKSQYDEYLRLYGKSPSHIDGHRHLHLCMNMMIDSIIPFGTKVRRHFTFWKGEKDVFNRLYRRIADRIIKRRYYITDYFFDILPISQSRIQSILDRANCSSVELMVHPERGKEYPYLMSDEFWHAISNVQRGGYSYWVPQAFPR